MRDDENHDETEDVEDVDDIEEIEYELPESLFLILRMYPDYGRKALADMIETNRSGFATYDALLATYDQVGEGDLEPEHVATRRDHRVMLRQLRDRCARTLANLERLRNRLD